MIKRYDITTDRLIEVDQKYFDQMQNQLIKFSKLIWALKKISDVELQEILNLEKK